MTTAEPGSRAGVRAGSPTADRAVEPVRLQRLVEAGPAVAYTRDVRPPHRVTFVSANVGRLFGLTVEELLTASRPFGGRLHPDDERTVADHWDRLLREGRAVSEYRLLRPSGSP
jgi:PAS domain-containing protein